MYKQPVHLKLNDKAEKRLAQKLAFREQFEQRRKKELQKKGEASE